MKQPLALARREGGQRRRLSGKFGGSRQTTTNFFVAKELMADGILMPLEASVIPLPLFSLSARMCQHWLLERKDLAKHPVHTYASEV
jgi:hypothetical protein